MKIVLGSTSPRRKAVLSGIFDSFEIIAPDVDERPRGTESPIEFSMRISEDKSRSIMSQCAEDQSPCLIITADTVVVLDGEIIGKPVDFNDAVKTISRLNGKTHQVVTGLCLRACLGGPENFRIRTSFEITEVKFRGLGHEVIVRYLSRIDYRDKAGSYALQEDGDMIIERYEGSVTNIIGFPLRLFFSMVTDMGLAEAVFN
jgi:septum formation protein